ncbi:FTR1 family protein [Neobacillus niacini]|uniref:FTR1 family iron permease n=1 Tax=Neobacillus niacini TaxID=86668 RepID=UPI00285BA1E7|nr:FTR1 family protein [Neobacillus niacini]MDR6999492.1 high-affinity iron transporter [Neobacillus niacini]
MKKWIIVPLLICFMLISHQVSAAGSWDGVVSDINGFLNKAMDEYEEGNKTKAKEWVNEAYFGPFESDKMEQAIRINISSKRAAEIEFQFNGIKKKMVAGEDIKTIQQDVDDLMEMLKTDKNILLKAEQGSRGLWFYSFLIIVREGLEAILVISAIVAFLIKSGNISRVKEVYQSTVIAILASFITAYLFQTLIHVSGRAQEVMEGTILFIATAFLFSMGYWMFRNADPKRWKQYIEGKIKDSLTNRKRLMLWFAVFLAVYREGAETVLFYQALLADSPGETTPVWLGFIAGAVVLIILFFIIRFTSTRLPLRPFFILSGILLYVLAFIFAGEGMKELQAGGLFSNSTISGFPVSGTLGIYPSWEGIGIQSFIILAMILAILFRKKKTTINTFNKGAEQ